MDGNGYTISELSPKKLFPGGLFKKNCGTIKNLNVSTPDDGFELTNIYSVDFGLIAGTNIGTIENCHASGKIIITPINSYDMPNIGSIACSNYGTINFCSSNVDISTTKYYIHVGGIAAYNYTDGVISQCSAKGTLKSYSGGIAYSNHGTIENCYAATSGTYHGITLGGTVTNCFYDRNLTTATDSTYGTPKTTTGMKMKKTFTNANWDFDTIWGIDKNINDGYPYLLWEYPDAETTPRYTLDSITMKNANGEVISEIPSDSFFIEINATKNDNSKTADSLVIAIYNEENALLDVKFMNGIFYQNQSVRFGAMIDKTDSKIGKIKTFVWDSIGGMVPLSNIGE